MICELRIYYMHPGKMHAIHKRFSEVTLALFSKHGMRVTDFWEDAEGKSTLYYIMEHQDMESRNRNFKAFGNDLEWIEAKTKSEMEGPIVEKVESFFMKSVPYFPKR